MLPSATIHYMILSQEQSAPHIYLRDDESMSFACRMYSIFAWNILGNPRLLIGWETVSTSFFGIAMMTLILSGGEFFKWRPTYLENQDVMNAHFNFWYWQLEASVKGLDAARRGSYKDRIMLMESQTQSKELQA